MGSRRLYIVWLLVGSLLVLSNWPTWAASSPLKVRKLLASDGAEGRLFAFSASLSADGNTALISACGDASSPDAVYVFTRFGLLWTQQAKLSVGDTGAGERFGLSIALSGDGRTALIGALDNQEYYSVYVFTRDAGSSWIEQAKLIPSDSTGYDRFGESMSLSVDGSTVLIGASGNASSQGAAYVFSRAPDGNWTEQAKLTEVNGTIGHRFGTSLSLSTDGKTALIGELIFKEDGLIDSNTFDGSYDAAAYFFSQGIDGTWTQEDKLTATDGMLGNYVSPALALSVESKTALVGDILHETAYVFIHSSNGWKQQAKLTAADCQALDGFSVAIALSTDGKTALITAPGKDNGKGAAYLFTRARTGRRWLQRSRLTAPDTPSAAPGSQTFDECFGCAVSLSAHGETALIGSPYNDKKGIDAGAAYVFMSKRPQRSPGKTKLDRRKGGHAAN